MSETVQQENAGKAPVFEVLRFGVEREPVVVIDDFIAAPEQLRDTARQQQFKPAGHHYPGHRAPAPSAYLAERMDVLEKVLRDVFGMASGASLIECSYSLVTMPEASLTPIQRLPHFDGTDPGRVALLHYLCQPEEGGTDFYRHVSTGFETITEDRLPAYDAALRKEAEAKGLPEAAYFSGSSEQFEMIGSVEAAWNRMVIYRGLQLHSGRIMKAHEIGTPGFRPRLTVNTFLAAKI